MAGDVKHSQQRIFGSSTLDKGLDMPNTEGWAMQQQDARGCSQNQHSTHSKKTHAPQLNGSIHVTHSHGACGWYLLCCCLLAFFHDRAALVLFVTFVLAYCEAC